MDSGLKMLIESIYYWLLATVATATKKIQHLLQVLGIIEACDSLKILVTVSSQQWPHLVQRQV